MAKVILLSQFELPYSKVGSWTTMYRNYFEQGFSKIDYVVCPRSEKKFENVHYYYLDEGLLGKIKRRISKKLTYSHYFEALSDLYQEGETYIIQIVDSYGIVKPLIEFLEKKGIRKNFYLQFFYHGFPPFYEDFQSRFFFSNIEEMVLLTHDSYQVHKNYYTILPCRFSVLHNGIDTGKFHRLPAEEKNKLRTKEGVAAKTVFIWCSQDRPKKGLDMILEAWKTVSQQHADVELWVIGCTREVTIEGVKFLGVIPNDELPKYFQMGDCYLFPTLCKEGFGLSLIEALHCGNYCIASAVGGVPEVLQNGALGKLIDTPHFVEAWISSITEFLEQRPDVNIPLQLYSSTTWNKEMNTIIEKAQKSFN
jgi:L-malate glycosyltransferase